MSAQKTEKLTHVELRRAHGKALAEADSDAAPSAPSQPNRAQRRQRQVGLSAFDRAVMRGRWEVKRLARQQFKPRSILMTRPPCLAAAHRYGGVPAEGALCRDHFQPDLPVYTSDPRSARRKPLNPPDDHPHPLVRRCAEAPRRPAMAARHRRGRAGGSV